MTPESHHPWPTPWNVFHGITIINPWSRKPWSLRPQTEWTMIRDSGLKWLLRSMPCPVCEGHFVLRVKSCVKYRCQISFSSVTPMKIYVVSDMTPCKLVEHFGGACCFHLQESPRKITWTWRQHAPLKYWNLYTNEHSYNLTLVIVVNIMCVVSSAYSLCLIISLSQAHTLCACRIFNISFCLCSDFHRDCS